MVSSSSARRYARALFESTADDKQREQLVYDMNRVVELNSDATISYYLSNPRISFNQKSQRLTDMLGTTNPLLPKLVGVLIAKHKMNILAGIADEFQRLLDNQRGIERARVISAVPLSDDIQAALNRRLARLFGKDIVIDLTINPSLIGGLVVRVGDKLLDGSTKTTLDSLRKTISP